jgi:hypothetical protein
VVNAFQLERFSFAYTVDPVQSSFLGLEYSTNLEKVIFFFDLGFDSRYEGLNPNLKPIIAGKTNNCDPNLIVPEIDL